MALARGYAMARHRLALVINYVRSVDGNMVVGSDSRTLCTM